MAKPPGGLGVVYALMLAGAAATLGAANACRGDPRLAGVGLPAGA